MLFLNMLSLKKFIMLLNPMSFNSLSPHILVYKPQTNSTFSLFLRFLLIVAFIDFVLYSLYVPFLSYPIFIYLLDLVYFSEVIMVFYVLAFLGEDLIDYDDISLNYWDIDLVTFFNFFFIFTLFLLLLTVVCLLLKYAF